MTDMQMTDCAADISSEQDEQAVAVIEKQAAEERRIHKRLGIRRRLMRLIAIFIGSLIAAFALEICLLPNRVIDGGVVGVSMMLSHVSGMSLSMFLILLNIPFLFIGYKQIGKSFAIYTLCGIASLSFWTKFFEDYEAFFNDTLLAAVFGGIILGIGIGLVVRNGGSLDGTEIISIIAGKRIPFSVGEVVLFINIFIFGVAGLVLGWEQALYSLLTYFVASKAIDVVVEGINESKAVFIITDQSDEITDALLARLGRGITIMEGEGGYSKDQKMVLYAVITRLEISKLKAIVTDIDPHAFVTISDVHEVMGGSFQKRAVH